MYTQIDDRLGQLMCAVGGVLVFIAKSEWRGGEQKKMEKVEFDMPSININLRHMSAGKRVRG